MIIDEIVREIHLAEYKCYEHTNEKPRLAIYITRKAARKIDEEFLDSFSYYAREFQNNKEVNQNKICGYPFWTVIDKDHPPFQVVRLS